MKKSTVLTLVMLYSPILCAAEYQATLQWSHRVELSTSVSGAVNAVNVDVGDKVGKGQALLTLDNTIFTAAVAQGRAETERLKAAVEEDKRELDRVQELHDRTVASTAELDQARLTEIRSSSMLAEARARLAQHQKLLDDTVLRAPFDAVVIARHAELGQSVAVQLQPQALLALAKSGEMIARIQIPATEMKEMKIGQAANVSVHGTEYRGKVKTLGMEPVSTPQGAVYPVDVLFVSNDQLRSGSTAKVVIP